MVADQKPKTENECLKLRTCDDSELDCSVFLSEENYPIIKQNTETLKTYINWFEE